MGVSLGCEIDIFYEPMIRNNLRLENLLFFIMDEADKWEDI